MIRLQQLRHAVMHVGNECIRRGCQPDRPTISEDSSGLLVARFHSHPTMIDAARRVGSTCVETVETGERQLSYIRTSRVSLPAISVAANGLMARSGNSQSCRSHLPARWLASCRD
jgi:hypothetical protein